MRLIRDKRTLAVIELFNNLTRLNANKVDISNNINPITQQYVLYDYHFHAINELISLLKNNTSLPFKSINIVN